MTPKNGEALVTEAIIIGGGQAGLAMGYELTRRGFGIVILDSGPEIGRVWRGRWDSLTLFTPAQYDGLPGFPFPAEPDTYPGKDDVAKYLHDYAQRFDLPVRLNARAVELRRDGDGYIVEAAGQLYAAPQVVLATGPFQAPSIPSLARGADSGVVQLHSSEYRNPAAFRGERVLVAGGGNSGCQIALELSGLRRVDLSIGDQQPVLPQRFLGRDLWWWNVKLGLHKLSVESRLGRRLRSRDPVIGVGPAVLSKRHGIVVRPRVKDISGRTVTFADESSTQPDAIIWATGYRTDFSWVGVPGAVDRSGQPVHRHGVTSSPGLYYIGLPWLWTRGSALLGFIKDDVNYLGERMAAFRSARTPARPG